MTAPALTGNLSDLVIGTRIVWVDLEDFASTGRAVFEVTPEGALLELPRGRRGEKGEKGEPANPIRMGAAVATAANLPTTYTERDANTCHPCQADKSLRVWTGSAWLTYPNWIGVKGDTGATPSIQVGRVEEGTTPQVNLGSGSTPETPVLNFVLPAGKPGPMGERGPVGPANNIATATDYDTTTSATHGDSLTWDSTAKKWRPRAVTAPVGPWTLSAAEFKEANVGILDFGRMERVIIGELTVPGLPFDWKPVVSGNVEVSTSGGVFVDIEVRTGSATNGPMVGVATGIPGQDLGDFSRIYPYFEEKVTPGNGAGRIPANTATTFFVSAKRTAGIAGAWRTKRFRNQLTVMAQPLIAGLA